jgi:iron complex outermembrane receptor protein
LKKFVPFVGLAFVSAFSTQAQNDIRSLDSVVIRENRWQVSRDNHNRDIQVITQEQIRNLPVKSLNEVLSYALGVDVRQRGPWGGQADVSIDGSTFDQVVILINGVRMSDPQTGHNMMNLPIASGVIDHIEVLRGAASAQYGVNALAAAINIVTRVPDADKLWAQVYYGQPLSQNDPTEVRNGGGVQAVVALVGKKVSQQMSGSFDLKSTETSPKNSKATRFFYQNEWAINKQLSLSSQAGYVDNNFDAHFYYAAPIDSYADERVKTFTAASALNYRYSEKGKFSVRASFRSNNDDYIFTRKDPEYYHNVHQTDVFGAELNWLVNLKNGHYAVGSEGRFEKIKSNNLDTNQRSNFGTYVEYGYAKNRLSAGANLYLNANSKYGNKFYPAVNVGYRIANNWKLFANGGMSQRLPTFTDLYYAGPTNVGNANLKPEEAIYAEGGVRYSGKYSRLNAQYSIREVKDFIDWVRNDIADPWQPMNFGSQTVQVISISGSQRIDRLWSSSGKKQLWLDLGWNHLDPKRSDPGGQYAKYTTEALKNQIIAALRFCGDTRLAGSVTARYQERFQANSYTLLDLHLEYRFPSVQFYADLTNILDQTYSEITSVPMPGRCLTAGFRLAM